MNYGAGTIQAPKSIAKTEENVYETSVEPVEVEHKSPATAGNHGALGG